MRQVALHGAFLAIAFSAVWMTGCPKKEAGPSDAGHAGCQSRADCPGGLASGLVCATDGSCHDCERDRECRPREFCNPIERRCKLRPCFGDQCEVHADCQLGQFCVQGLCLKSGTTSGSNCSVIPCDPGGDCGTNKRCNSATLVCEENLGCQGDQECPTGQRCNPGSGQCEAGCTDATATEVCGVKLKCLGGRCIECQNNTDCGVGLSCDTVAGKCVGETGCFTSRDCKVPLVCNRSTHTCTNRPPPCSSTEQCPVDEVCDVPSGECINGVCGKDKFDPNNTLADAKPISLGQTDGLLLCDGESDYFKFGLQSGDRLQVNAVVDPLIMFELDFLDGSGNLLANGDYLVDNQVGATGDYFVRAKSRDAFVRYGLRVSLSHGVPCTEDGFDPNNDYTHAHAADGSQNAYTNLQICSAQPDWFVVKIGAGQHVAATLDHDPTKGLINLYLHNSDGSSVAAKDATTAATKTLTFPGTPSAGLVYVEVRGDSPGVQNTYDLTVKVTGP